MKKILMLLQAPFPPDIRLEKEIRSLSAQQYNVSLLCNQYEKGNTPNFDSCEIYRIKAIFNSKKLNKLINFPIFFNPRFFISTITTYLKTKPEVIHAHDLPMMPMALILKFLFSIPVIYDMHECYPDALREFKKKGILNSIFKNPGIAELLDRVCMRYADKIIVVVEENKNRLIKLGIDEQKVFVVSNTVDLDTFSSKSSENLDVEQFSNRTIILYTGTVSPERGLDTPVIAMQKLKLEHPELLMLIIGDGPDKRNLQNIINNSGLSQHVKLLPWCGHENLNFYINQAKICMVPQPSNNFIDNTIPHKLFEYMSMSKVVLLSDAKPFSRIVDETHCGVNFASNNPEDFSEKVKLVLSSSIEFGKNGRKAVEEKYNWKNEEAHLFTLYRSL